MIKRVLVVVLVLAGLFSMLGCPDDEKKVSWPDWDTVATLCADPDGDDLSSLDGLDLAELRVDYDDDYVYFAIDYHDGDPNWTGGSHLLLIGLSTTKIYGVVCDYQGFEVGDMISQQIVSCKKKYKRDKDNDRLLIALDRDIFSGYSSFYIDVGTITWDGASGDDADDMPDAGPATFNF